VREARKSGTGNWTCWSRVRAVENDLGDFRAVKLRGKGRTFSVFLNSEEGEPVAFADALIRLGRKQRTSSQVVYAEIQTNTWRGIWYRARLMAGARWYLRTIGSRPPNISAADNAGLILWHCRTEWGEVGDERRFIEVQGPPKSVAVEEVRPTEAALLQLCCGSQEEGARRAGIVRYGRPQ